MVITKMNGRTIVNQEMIDTKEYSLLKLCDNYKNEVVLFIKPNEIDELIEVLVSAKGEK